MNDNMRAVCLSGEELGLPQFRNRIEERSHEQQHGGKEYDNVHHLSDLPGGNDSANLHSQTEFTASLFLLGHRHVNDVLTSREER
jgi:hypothetical protein